MNRPILFLMLATICLAGPASAGEKILISNQNNDSAELLDLVTLKSLAVTKIGRQPLTATVTYDRRFGLVASEGYTTNAGSVAVLDLTAAGLPVIATVSRNSRAYGVEAAPNSKVAIVTRVQGSTPQLQLVVANGPNSLVAFGEVHAHGVPAVGTTHPIYVASPTDAGKGYLLAASFATLPGIAIGSRTVPLNPDDLFALSQLVPSVFQNFAGVLNTKGQAMAAINIPAAPALRGFSFVVAGVVIDPTAPQGIGTITNAERIALQ